MAQELLLKEGITDQDILWAAVRESTIITCRLYPERCGDALIELIKAHKQLYPEKYEQR